MSQDEVIVRNEGEYAGGSGQVERPDDEHDANALELIYQNLSDLIKKNLLNPEAMLDHIAGRPPGECRAVTE